MILAGIDEAGLGPVLGPLATASAALEVPDGWGADAPWDAFSGVFCRERRKGDARLPVADSKVLYRAGGLAEFERVLGAAGLLAYGDIALRVSEVDADVCAAHPCYSGGDRSVCGAFPRYCSEEDIRAAARLVVSAGVSFVHLEAALLYESRLNARFDSGLNKNEALLVETGRHLVRLVERFAGRGLFVVVDKQGGRNAYLPFLTGLFPGAWVEEVLAGREVSRYRVRVSGGVAEIEFRAKGDRTSFATALASLAAKYARECAVSEMNRWFCERFPGLKKTAGYPEDAGRWLDDLRKLGGQKLGGDESAGLLIRRR